MMNNKVILGTVQMGLVYGINNISGKIPSDESYRILNEAYHSGIRFLDTAEAYGDAHRLIGSYHRNRNHPSFQTITKFPAADIALNLRNKIDHYLDQLSVSSLWGIMFHSFDALLQNENALKELMIIKKDEMVKHIGVSVYSNEELQKSLAYDEIDFIQLPFNILDNYTQRSEYLQQAKKSGKIIHTRSVFLQGLLFKEQDDFPSYLAPLKKYISQIQKIVQESQRTMEEVCLLYCLHQAEIDQVVIGVDNLKQLQRNLVSAEAEFSMDIIKQINNIHVQEVELLYPRNWNKL